MTVLTDIDSAFEAARAGDPDAFAVWMGCAERPIRESLRPFARAVDVESVVQETMLRMWIVAQDKKRRLKGNDASLRFALGVARNVAREETRRFKRETFMSGDELPEPSVAPDPPSDPGLRKAILECFQEIAPKPLKALRARIEFGSFRDDRSIAQLLRMRVNTFRQNLGRARQQLEECLRGKGVPLEEIRP
jgi:DNA-directed RNA polymerase specialized sigma24 family protein